MQVNAQAMRPATGSMAMAAFVSLLWLSGGAVAEDAKAAVATPPASAATCRRAATFRVVVDVGHTVDVPGAMSARGATEYDFNLRLAKEVDKELVAAGFDKTVLMITTEAPTAGLFRRVAQANGLKADVFLSIHHDAVPDQFVETWQYEGQEQHFSDRWAGHSLFVSYGNGDRAGSLAFAKLIGNGLEARGLHYTPHYTEKIMGNRQRQLLDPKAGVYRYDQLIVLKDTRMPAVLLEAGSIVNRTEELELATPERQMLIAGAVVEAVDAFCAERSKQGNRPQTAAKKSERPVRPATSTSAR
jgi:N-acetylmuramoyl-L-alanine amidase